MKNPFSRRTFIRMAAASAGLTVITKISSATVAVEGPLPTRLLGKTGVQVPIIGFGTAPVGTTRSIEQGIALFQAALDAGINYFDTAPEFSGYGKAQVQLGHAFKGRRKDVVIATKCAKPRGDEALKLLEQNLKELQTDYTDLLYVHSVGADEMDPAVVMGPGGIMEFLAKAKREGLARFVGVTGHNRPDRFLPIIQNYDIDVMMNAVNFIDRHTYNFEEKVWPEAAKKSIALVAMKVFGGAQGNKQGIAKLPLEHHESAFRYALSLPNVATAVIGMKTHEELQRNIEWAKLFKPMTSDELAALQPLGKTMAAQWKEHLGQLV